MDKAEFDSRIMAPIADKPQLVGLAQFHLANLHSAIAGLANMGHRVSLDFAPPPPTVEWPKMIYRGSGVGPEDTMLVSGQQQEDDALADGWRLTPNIQAEPPVNGQV